jgi:hypothetical protein
MPFYFTNIRKLAIVPVLHHHDDIAVTGKSGSNEDIVRSNAQLFADSDDLGHLRPVWCSPGSDPIAGATPADRP